MQPALKSTGIGSLSPSSERAIGIYESRLKHQLESDHLGQAVAIDANSGEYAIGPTHSLAARELRARQIPNAEIVTVTIGPPTSADLYITNRMMGLL
jgi:hypothetical protein